MQKWLQSFVVVGALTAAAPGPVALGQAEPVGARYWSREDGECKAKGPMARLLGESAPLTPRILAGRGLDPAYTAMFLDFLRLTPAEGRPDSGRPYIRNILAVYGGDNCLGELIEEPFNTMNVSSVALRFLALAGERDAIPLMRAILRDGGTVYSNALIRADDLTRAAYYLNAPELGPDFVLRMGRGDDKLDAGLVLPMLGALGSDAAIEACASRLQGNASDQACLRYLRMVDVPRAVQTRLVRFAQDDDEGWNLLLGSFAGNRQAKAKLQRMRYGRSREIALANHGIREGWTAVSQIIENERRGDMKAFRFLSDARANRGRIKRLLRTASARNHGLRPYALVERMRRGDKSARRQVIDILRNGSADERAYAVDFLSGEYGSGDKFPQFVVIDRALIQPLLAIDRNENVERNVRNQAFVIALRIFSRTR